MMECIDTSIANTEDGCYFPRNPPAGISRCAEDLVTSARQSIPSRLRRCHFHAKAFGAFASAPGLPHGDVGIFDIPAEKVGVEEWMGKPVAGQLLLHLRHGLRMAG